MSKPICLITRREPCGTLYYDPKGNAKTPQEAVDSYDGKYTPLAWMYGTPERPGMLPDLLALAMREGRVIDKVGSKLVVRPIAPPADKANAAMLQRDGPAKPNDQAAEQERKRAQHRRFEERQVKPSPFASFTSPDLVGFRPNPLHGSAALL